MVVLKPNVVRGGRAIGLGNNLYLMKGRTHSKGGIDIGKNPKTGLEVENNEVMQVSPQGVRVFSAQPILGGISPAQYILGGANPNQVFAAQEQWKKVNKINDDGTRKARFGKEEIVAKRYNSAYRALIKNGYTDKDAERLVPFIISQSILESGYVDKDDNNYGGYLKNGKRIKYNSEEEFYNSHINNLKNKWPTIFNAKDIEDYLRIIHGGDIKEGKIWDYAPKEENNNYDNRVKSVYNKINNYIDVYRKNYKNRDFVTKLDPIEEQEFQKWYKSQAVVNGISLNPDDKEHYYDYRGFWKENRGKSNIGHFTDKYKIPGHPTFSEESIYSEPIVKGGKWNTIYTPIKEEKFVPSNYNLNYKFGGRKIAQFGKYDVSRYEDRPIEEEKIYTDNITPSVITAELPKKFKGSQVAANRYAEAYKFGKKIIEKRDNEFKKAAPIVFGLPILGGIGIGETVAGLAVSPIATILGLIGGGGGSKVGEKIGGVPGSIVGGLIGGAIGGGVGSIGDFAIKDGIKFYGRNLKKFGKLFNYGYDNAAESSNNKYYFDSKIEKNLASEMESVAKNMASVEGLTKNDKRKIAKKIIFATKISNPNYERSIKDFDIKFKKYATTPELKKIFKENPEYLAFIDETGFNPLEQKTIDAFAERQSSSIRGVHGTENEIVPFLTKSEYKEKIDLNKRGGDRLGTRGGVYTSNRYAIADVFRRPVDEKLATSKGEKSVIGKIRFPIKYDKTKSAKNQLRDIRSNIINIDDYNHLRDLDDKVYFDDIIKAAINKNIKGIESQYSRSNGQKVDAFERASIGNYNLDLNEIETSHLLSNMRGRWGLNGVDEYPVDKEFFIPQSTTKADIKKYLDLIDRKRFDKDLAIKHFYTFQEQIRKTNNIIRNSYPYKLGYNIKNIKNNSKLLLNYLKDNKESFGALGLAGTAIGGILYGIKLDSKYREEYEKSDIHEKILNKYKNRTNVENFKKNREDAMKALGEMSEEDKKGFKEYKKNRLKFKYGGIHIKPSKRGTFTATAKKHGMSVQGFASKVLANKGKYSSAMVKKANFARNASKWKHKEFGGDMDFNYWITKDNIYKLGGRKKGQWGLQDYSNSFKVNLQPFTPTTVPATTLNVNNALSLGIPNIIGAGLNLAGNIGSYFVNRRALKSMQAPVAPSAPSPLRAENLETRVSTAAQEAALRENVAKQENLIAGNLSSSRSRLNAVNAIRNQGIGLYNQLQERKQNVQTELINRAKLNRQQINNQNTLLANQYKDKVTNWRNSVIDFENKRKDALSENTIQHLIQGPIDAIAGERGFFANLQSNDKYRMTAFLQAITSPDALKAMNSNEIRQLAQKFGVRTSWLRSIGINV